MEDYSYTDALDRTLFLKKESERLKTVRVSLFREPKVVNLNSLKMGILGNLKGQTSLGLEKLSEWQNFIGYKLDAILLLGDFVCESTELNKYFGLDGVFSDISLFYISGDENIIEKSYYKNIKHIQNGDFITVTKYDLEMNVGSLGHNYSNGDIKKLTNFNLDILLSYYPFSDIDSKHYNEGLNYFLSSNNKMIKLCGNSYNVPIEKTNKYNNQYVLNKSNPNRRKLNSGSMGYLQFSNEELFFLYLPENQDDLVCINK